MKISFVISVSLWTMCAVGAKVLPQKTQSHPQNYVKCSTNNKILWPDYGDNKYYFECIGDDKFVKRPCPVKMVFNYRKQQCTWLENWVEPPIISNLVEPLQTPRMMSEFSPSCLESELHLLWPDPSVPQDYFRCIAVEQYERLSCTFGYVFVFMKQMCIADQPAT